MYPCSSCTTFFKPLSSSDQVNELLESVSTQALCFWNGEQDPSPETALELVQKSIFPLVRRSCLTKCMGMWCDTWGAEFWDTAQELTCADQNIRGQSSGFLYRTELWLSVPHRAAQCLVQQCGTDAVMWFSVWGSKRLPWVSLDCFLTFRAGNACSACLKSHSSLLWGSWTHSEQFVLTGMRQKSQKHQNLQSYPKTFEPL